MSRIKFVYIALFLLLGLAACQQGQTAAAPPEIRYGEDVCAECNMIISDVRFASGYAYEISEGRFQSLAFDDIGEMLKHAAKHPEHNIVSWYVHDFDSEEWLDAASALYVVSDKIQAPMGTGVTAHASQEAADRQAAQFQGEVIDWNELRKRFEAGTLLAILRLQ
jgi:copper chaperone NosL